MMKTKFALFGSIIAMFAASPAIATSQANITLTIQGIQIVDLDPNDGQAAGFIWQISDLDYGSAFTINTRAEHPPLTEAVYGNGSFSRNQAAAGLASAQAKALGSTALASAYMPAAAGNAFSLSAVGSASSFIGDPNTPPSSFYALAGGGSFGRLFLSTNTQITMTGVVAATIAGSSDMVSNNNTANVVWGVRLRDGSQGWDEEGSLSENSANGAFSKTQTWSFELTRSYAPNGNPILSFGAEVYVVGGGAVTPVPEPNSAGLFAIGLLAIVVGALRRRNAFSQMH